jgi:hypothetical protein
MNFETFFEQVKAEDVKVKMESRNISSTHFLDNEALFQLPLLCLIILLMAKDRRKPKVSEIGQLVGESIEASMIGFKGSAQHLGWSANLRVRTVNAMTFLEHIGLIDLYKKHLRIDITDLGKKVIKKALDNDDDLSYNLAKISRSYRNICVSKQLDLELL